MDLLSICIIGIGLAMDCFAVSISKGICVKKYLWTPTFKMAFLFGLFQAIMPLLGYAAGFRFAHYMEEFDHWIAFILLAIIGGKMLIEGLRSDGENCDTDCNHFKLKTLLSLALATSIDALATGIVFVSYPDIIWQAITIIGLISFLFAMIGMYIGVHFGKRFHLRVEIIGGVILIGIGTKILLQHLL